MCNAWQVATAAEFCKCPRVHVCLCLGSQNGVIYGPLPFRGRRRRRQSHYHCENTASRSREVATAMVEWVEATEQVGRLTLDGRLI